MSKIRTLWMGLLGAAVLGAFHMGQSDLLSAQERPGRNLTSAEKELNQGQTRGEGLFRQRCAVCHLPRPLKFGSAPIVGPRLFGVFKTADREQEKALREFILKGGPDMPGFQYGLDSKEVDDLVSYLKTI
jgi:mono/diheme cytochrome c family protein